MSLQVFWKPITISRLIDLTFLQGAKSIMNQKFRPVGIKYFFLVLYRIILSKLSSSSYQLKDVHCWTYIPHTVRVQRGLGPIQGMRTTWWKSRRPTGGEKHGTGCFGNIWGKLMSGAGHLSGFQVNTLELLLAESYRKQYTHSGMCTHTHQFQLPLT